MAIQFVAKFERTLISNILLTAKSQLLSETCQKLAAVGFQLAKSLILCGLNLNPNPK